MAGAISDTKKKKKKKKEKKLLLLFTAQRPQMITCSVKLQGLRNGGIQAANTLSPVIKGFISMAVNREVSASFDSLMSRLVGFGHKHEV